MAIWSTATPIAVPLLVAATLCGYSIFSKASIFILQMHRVAILRTMVEETISVEDLSENLDPGLYQQSTHAAGATYEGD